MASKDDKDRLGDKLRDVERAREDHYFAERDRKLVEQMRQAKSTSLPCPKCGKPLQSSVHHGVSADACPSCHGMWLSHDELKKIATDESDGWIARWLRREFQQDE